MSLTASSSHFFQCTINHTLFHFSLGSKPHSPGLQSEVVRPSGDSGWSPGKELSECDADRLAPDIHRHVSPADDLQCGQSHCRHVQTAPAPQDRVTEDSPRARRPLRLELGGKDFVPSPGGELQWMQQSWEFACRLHLIFPRKARCHSSSYKEADPCRDCVISCTTVLRKQNI